MTFKRFDPNNPVQIRFLDEPTTGFFWKIDTKAFVKDAEDFKKMYLTEPNRHNCLHEEGPRCIFCENEVKITLLTDMARELFTENSFAFQGIELRLREDVKQWCIDNLEANMAKPFRNRSGRIDENGEPITIYGIRFLKLNDAIHFKLRWVGY
jgi:hypothetical protein